jgi:glycosyltransferase involved in cell wall biosynthesis
LVALVNADPHSNEHLVISLNGDLSALDLIESRQRVLGLDGREFMRSRFPWLKIRRWLSSHEPDRLLTYNWGACDWAIAALGTGIPHVAVEDGFGAEESQRRFFRRSLTRRLVFGLGKSRMVVPSRTLESIARAEWWIPRKRLCFIPNGVDSTRFKPAFESEDVAGKRGDRKEWVIGTLAGLRSEKRLDRLIDVLAQIREHHRVRLLIGGVGPLEQSLRAHCERQGVQQAVEFVGFVKDAPAFLSVLDVFVLTSDTEQLPISMIEAMMSGLPVVASDVGDIRRSLPPIQAEGVVPPTATDLSCALSSLLKVPDRMIEWGLANRAFAIERFSLQFMSEAWRRVYDGSEIDVPTLPDPNETESGKAQSEALAAGKSSRARVLVFSSLFPSSAAPQAGIFIKERMSRVANRIPVVVVSPQPWSPFDPLIRLFRANFRPRGCRHEVMDGIRVFRPRFFSLPSIFKGLDGWMMAACSDRLVRYLLREFKPTAIDAHFVYPDGYAAGVLARRYGLPHTITLRGSKDESLIGTARETALRRALSSADLIFSVSDALKRDVGLRLGQPDHKIRVVRNGVDLERFFPVGRVQARQRFGLRPHDNVLVSAGRLVEGKGFHRLIPLLSRLSDQYPNLHLLIAGAGTTSEDMEQSLRDLAAEAGLADRVHFCGALSHEDMRYFYSAGDVFCLATRYEGWANVFLEAMACGLPVVTTDVGGNSQVIRLEEVGALVPFWDADAFGQALKDALGRNWDRNAIRSYAMQHGWDQPIEDLISTFSDLGAS